MIRYLKVLIRIKPIIKNRKDQGENVLHGTVEKICRYNVFVKH